MNRGIRTVPSGFNKQVQRHLGKLNVSGSYITCVRKGKRTNDAILMAIIEVDHINQHGAKRKGIEWFL